MKFVVALLLLTIVAVSARDLVGLRGARSLQATDLCSTGKAQSPIDINPKDTECVRHGDPHSVPYRIHFHYPPTHNATVTNTGSTIQLNGNFGFVTVGGCNPCTGQEWDFTNAVFKMPAEHTLDGKQYAMELQLSHTKKGASDQLIVSIFFYQQADGGFPNGFLEAIDWTHAPTSANAVNNLKTHVHLRHLLKESLRGEYFMYKGSITSSPCTEGVQWYVMKTPLGATSDEITQAKSLLAGFNNARSVNPLNGRHVTWYRKPDGHLDFSD